MVKKVLAAFFVVLAFVSIHADPSTDSTRLNGPDLRQIKGWLAGIYPAWPYDTAMAAVAPVLNLWTPAVGDFRPAQSFAQVAYQNNQLEQYGSGADVLEFNPNPDYGDLNRWGRVYFSQGTRPFFLLYEHLNGTRFKPISDNSGGFYFDMSDPYNRDIFTQDIDFIYNNIVLPNASRYVTHNGRAVIYMWATSGMHGDFGGLMNEVAKKYPVSFFGSEPVVPADLDGINRIKAMDGIMLYATLDPDNKGSYTHMIQTYYTFALGLKQFYRKLETENPAKHWMLIPTFQSAYDDSRILERQISDGTPKTIPIYPRTRDELMLNAQVLKNGMTVDHTFDPVGPFVVYSELYEGAATIESLSGTLAPCVPGQQQLNFAVSRLPLCGYAGYGTGRLDVVKQFFGK